MSRLCLIVLVIGWTAAPTRAALDPESTKPYRVQVILYTARHPVFTALFKDRLRRGLEDGLQAALGKMGRVEQPDTKEQRARNLLGEVEKHGLQKALDNWKEVSDTKTHFVRLDFADGEYVIQARQFDGLTGLPSPVVREARTSDHEFVLRLASYLIHQDFGIVGTLEPSFTLPEVNLTLKGGGLGQPLGPWVKKGEVFAVAQIQQVGGGQRAARVAETLVQVLEEPRGAVCRCRVLYRFENPLPRGGKIVGYRCLKLGTMKARLQLQLVDNQGIPLANRRFVVSQDDFAPGPRTSEGATNADGFTPALGPFEHLARVRVLDNPSGTKIQAQFPVAILDDHVVVRSVEVDPMIEQLGQLESDKEHLIKHLDESLLAVSGLVEELDRISRSKNWEEALKQADTGLKTLSADLARHNEELVNLKKAGASKLIAAEERYAALQQRQEMIRKFVTRVEKAKKEEKDPLRIKLRQMAEAAQLNESEAEYGKAIALYEQVLKEGGNAPALQQYATHLEQLKKTWEPKSDAHRQARAFIYETWPNLPSARELKAHIDTARKALQTCMDVGDRMTPLKLLKSNTAHATNLTKRLDTVRASTSAEDKKEVLAIAEVQEDIKKLTTAATNFVEKPAEKPPR